MSNEQAASPSQDSAAREPQASSIPAQIALLYESRDGKLCLFEDAQGHLTAVRASKLA